MDPGVGRGQDGSGDDQPLTRNKLLVVIKRLEAHIKQQDARIKQLEDLVDKDTRRQTAGGAVFQRGAQAGPEDPRSKAGHGPRSGRPSRGADWNIDSAPCRPDSLQVAQRAMSYALIMSNQANDSVSLSD